VSAAAERKVVLVTRRTRLQELLSRHHSLAQARFYLERLGADFGDYLQEDAHYTAALQQATQALRAWGRHQVLDRNYLPNFVFASDDIVVALGQDGLVANTVKYLRGQPLVGVNPDPARWDGALLPYQAAELASLLPRVANDAVPTRSVTLAEVRLSDGQTLLAANDLFIGPRSHTSALYELALGGRREVQSSSGLIVATGLGSGAWMRSVVTGSLAVAAALTGSHGGADWKPLPWDARQLVFAVREPFPSRVTGTAISYGVVTESEPLRIRSRMPEHGVIFSDGIESDFVRFTAGLEASIGVATLRGSLVHPS
jgi:NAD kinase